MVPHKGDVYMREIQVEEDGTVSIRLVAVETDWGTECGLCLGSRNERRDEEVGVGRALIAVGRAPYAHLGDASPLVYGLRILFCLS